MPELLEEPQTVVGILGIVELSLGRAGGAVAPCTLVTNLVGLTVKPARQQQHGSAHGPEPSYKIAVQTRSTLSKTRSH